MDENNVNQIDEVKKDKKTSPRQFSNEMFEWLEMLAVIPFLLVVFLLTFFVRLTMVDGDSMLPTLHDKEVLLLSKTAYEPEYNDIIVIHTPKLYDAGTGEYGKAIVKRVVGLPGDIIDIDFDEGIVYRNGDPLTISADEKGILFEDGHMINDLTTSPRGDFEEAVKVPENHVFVLGDNRTNSLDGRSFEIDAITDNYDSSYSDIRKNHNGAGFVSNDYIMGKVFFRIFPFTSFGGLN